MKQLTQDRVKELLEYNKDTGEFVWIKRSSSKASLVKIGAIAGSINTQGYRIIWIDGKGYRASYLALLYVDNIHSTKTVVFLNGDRGDTRYSNLDTVYNFSNFELTQDNLLNVIEYIPETGEFIRLVTMGAVALRGSSAGALTKAGYSIIALGKNRYYAHRLAYFYMLGVMPTDDIDHLDGNPSNNSWINLRDATKSENMANQKLRIDNISGVKGVIYRKEYDNYGVTITKAGKRIWLGSYPTLEEASEIAIKGREQLHKEFARQK